MTSNFESLMNLKNQTLTCTMCGYCKMVCPVFLDSHWDSTSPRGRMTIAYGLITGEIEPDEQVSEKMFTCTQCTDCYRRCPSKAKCPDIVRAARKELIDRGFVSPSQQKLVQNVLTSGNIYADPDLSIPHKDGIDPVFIGCQHLSRPNNTKKSLKLMETVGMQPSTQPEVCCGFPLYIMGFEKEHQQQLDRLKSTFRTNGRPITTLCPSCLVHLKHAGFPAVHILTVLNERIREPLPEQAGIKVTYHDPCDLSRGAQITQEPRQLLTKMGYHLIEMPHSKDQSRCCGGGGGLLAFDADLSERLAASRIKEAISTGAEMLVTACATCEQTLKKAASALAAQTGTPVLPVRHLLDLLSKSIK